MSFFVFIDKSASNKKGEKLVSVCGLSLSLSFALTLSHHSQSSHRLLRQRLPVKEFRAGPLVVVVAIALVAFNREQLSHSRALPVAILLCVVGNQLRKQRKIMSKLC